MSTLFCGACEKHCSLPIFLKRMSDIVFDLKNL